MCPTWFHLSECLSLKAGFPLVFTHVYFCFAELYNREPFQQLYSLYYIAMELLARCMFPSILQSRLFSLSIKTVTMLASSWRHVRNLFSFILFFRSGIPIKIFFSSDWQSCIDLMTLVTLSKTLCYNSFSSPRGIYGYLRG